MHNFTGTHTLQQAGPAVCPGGGRGGCGRVLPALGRHDGPVSSYPNTWWPVRLAAEMLEHTFKFH